MDISSLNVAQSCLCGNEGKIISFLYENFVDYACCTEASFLLWKKRQGSTSSPPLGQPTSSSTLLPSPGHVNIDRFNH